jgi:hypothetical protein
MQLLGDPHNTTGIINSIDFELRRMIGKDIEIQGGLCSHSAILDREMPENTCRICNKELKIGIARWNDYLILRNARCTRPICDECSKVNPDDFHNAFREGLRLIRIDNSIKKRTQVSSND